MKWEERKFNNYQECWTQGSFKFDWFICNLFWKRFLNLGISEVTHAPYDSGSRKKLRVFNTKPASSPYLNCIRLLQCHYCYIFSSFCFCFFIPSSMSDGWCGMGHGSKKFWCESVSTIQSVDNTRPGSW